MKKLLLFASLLVGVGMQASADSETNVWNPTGLTFYYTDVYAEIWGETNQTDFPAMRSWHSDGMRIRTTGGKYLEMYPVNNESLTLLRLREDNGRLYLKNGDYLFAPDVDAAVFQEICYDRLSDDNGINPLESVEEFVLTDFNVQAGLKYDLLSCWDDFGKIANYPEDWTKVLVNDNIKVNGKVYRRQLIYTNSETDNHLKFGSEVPDDNGGNVVFVEGIGCDRGHFFVPAGFNQTTGWVFEKTPMFDRVEDSEGNVVFRLADFYSAPYDPSKMYASMLRTDCEWEYLRTSTAADGSVSYRIERTGLSGAENRNGKNYCRYVLKGYDEWSTDGDESQTPATVNRVENLDTELALLREENGKVFMFVSEPTAQQGEEVVLYDFTLDTGDMATSTVGGNITRTGVTEIEGAKLKWLSDRAATGGEVRYMESVGNIGVGDMLNIVGSDDASSVRFNRLLDTYGNEVYVSENAVKSPISGIDGIEADRLGDGRMYDLMGREIRNPLPGTIYIQNGEKHIAR